MDILAVNVVYRWFEAETPTQAIRNGLVGKPLNAKVQFFRYIFVGGFAAVVNLALTYTFTSVANVHYLTSEFIAFVVATVVNYLLSIWWIFEKSSHFKLEFMIFTLIGVGGLAINEFVLWLCVSKGKLYYLLGEAIAIAVVTLWSFVLRKVLFEKLASLA